MLQIKKSLIFFLFLIVFLIRLHNIYAEGKAIFCPSNLTPDDVTALDYAREAKVHFNYPHVQRWDEYGSSDSREVDFVKLQKALNLNLFYGNHIQTFIRMGSLAALGWGNEVPAGPNIPNTMTFEEYRYLWLEKYAKPFITWCYERGIYIFDIGAEGAYVPPDANGMMTFYGLAPMPHSEFLSKYVATLEELYQWKMEHYPKVILGWSHNMDYDSMTVMFGKLLPKSLDWVGVDSGPRLRASPGVGKNNLEDFYKFMKSLIENKTNAYWGILQAESFSIFTENFARDIEYMQSYDSKNYIKFFVYCDWRSRTGDGWCGHMNTYTFLDSPHPIGTLIGNCTVCGNRHSLYNQWGPSKPDPAPNGKYNYLKNTMHSGTNSYWDSEPQWPLVITRDGLKYNRENNTVSLTLRNICADKSISANIHIYACPKGTTPWNRTRLVKATPANIQNSLKGNFEVAFINQSKYSVPGNGGLDTANNVVTLTAKLSRVPQDNENIYIYIEDSELVKGWTAENNMPVIQGGTQ